MAVTNDRVELLDNGQRLLAAAGKLTTLTPGDEVVLKGHTKEIGRRREAHRIGGQAYDVIYMDCLATEFMSPVLHTLLPG